MKKFLICIHFILSVLFVYCVNTIYYSSSIHAIYQNYNIFTLAIISGISYFMLKSWKFYFDMPARRRIFLALGFLFSIFFICGTRIMLYECIELQSPLLWFSILLTAYVFTGIIILLYHQMLPQLKDLLYAKSYPKLEIIIARVPFSVIWLLLFLCWLPILLACYPGIFTYDANVQCAQIGDTLNLNTHHPIIHTLFLGGCIRLGKVFFHSANTGMLIYSVIQMLINSGIFAYILYFLRKSKVPSVVQTLCFLFFAFMPFNSVLAICTTKDSIFAAVFALLFTQTYRIIKDSDSFFGTWKYPITFSITAFIAIIFRNNMLYAFILCIPFLLIIYRKYWKKGLIMFLLPVLLLKLYEGILYPALNVTSGDSREAYSVIMQQYAYVYTTCEISDEDKALLQQLMSDEEWSKYEPHKSDAIKSCFRTDVFQNNLSEYLKLWISLGIHHPSQYINAFLNLTFGYWYPNDALPDTTTYRKYIEIKADGDITFQSKFPTLFEGIQNLGMESSYQSIPGLSMIFSPAFYLWILLFMCAVWIYEKKWSFLVWMLLPATFFLSILFGPVALLRYMYPIILCVPPALALGGIQK